MIDVEAQSISKVKENKRQMDMEVSEGEKRIGELEKEIEQSLVAAHE